MKTEIIKQTNEETEYRYCDQSGDAALSVCHVFDGVDIIYNSVHMTECDLGAGNQVISLKSITAEREGLSMNAATSLYI